MAEQNYYGIYWDPTSSNPKKRKIENEKMIESEAITGYLSTYKQLSDTIVPLLTSATDCIQLCGSSLSNLLTQDCWNKLSQKTIITEVLLPNPLTSESPWEKTQQTLSILQYIKKCPNKEIAVYLSSTDPMSYIRIDDNIFIVHEMGTQYIFVHKHNKTEDPVLFSKFEQMYKSEVLECNQNWEKTWEISSRLLFSQQAHASLPLLKMCGLSDIGILELFLANKQTKLSTDIHNCLTKQVSAYKKMIHRNYVVLLPVDVTAYLMQNFLSVQDIGRCMRTCKYWLNIVQSNLFGKYWEKFYKSFGTDLGIMRYMKDLNWVTIIRNLFNKLYKIRDECEELVELMELEGFACCESIVEMPTAFANGPPGKVFLVSWANEKDWQYFVNYIANGVDWCGCFYLVQPISPYMPPCELYVTWEEEKLKNFQAEKTIESTLGFTCEIETKNKYLFLATRTNKWEFYLQWTGPLKGSVWLYDQGTEQKFTLHSVSFLQWLRSEIECAHLYDKF